MIRSRKKQLVMVLISVCTCGLLLGAEPNETKVGLKFEISTDEKPWFISSRTDEIGQGPINPTHVAHFYINEKQKCPNLPGSRWIKSILESSAGQSMSQKQKNFVKTGREDFLRLGIFSELGPMKQGFYYFRLFATSEDDAKKMTQALIEVLTNEANAKLQKLQTERQELQKKIVEAKKKILEKKSETEAAGAKLREMLKDETHSLYGSLVKSSNAPNEAKKTVLEMNRMLDVLNIEIIGIEAKLSAIEKYKSKKNVSIERLAKLEQMLCEQTIELAGALAKKEAALKIRKRDEEFYNLYRQWGDLTRQVDKLRGHVHGYERMLRRANEKITNQTPELLPPQVYQNKATIYPVLAEE